MATVGMLNPSQQITGLEVVIGLARELEKENICYCHWKSNEHVYEGMLGITDLDVLIEKCPSDILNQALARAGFKCFATVPTNAYPGVEDYLAMDTDTGRLVHLHLHHQLVAGEAHLKGYRLPWEKLVLNTSYVDPTHGIRVADPNIELLLLLVRATLKLRLRDRFLAILGRNYFQGDFEREFNWLRERIAKEKVAQWAMELLGKEAAISCQQLIDRGPTFAELLNFRRLSMPLLRLYRSYSLVEGKLRGLWRELHWLFGAISRRYLHRPGLFRRVPCSGGVLVAFLGCDGSGKSSLAENVTRWLSWKIDAMPIYFGSGDGPSSLLRWPLKVTLAMLQKVGMLRRQPGEKSGGDNNRINGGKNFSISLRLALKVPWALVLSLEKRSKLRRATRARNRGMIVICDRYPQNQVMGFGDGPLLSHWYNHPWKIKRILAQWEAMPYRMAELYPPDLVIKLHVTPEIALQRKADVDVKEYKKRVAAVKQLRYSSFTRLVEIDANQVFDEVLLQVKHSLWNEV
jgi:thymidylate kinase